MTAVANIADLAARLHLLESERSIRARKCQYSERYDEKVMLGGLLRGGLGQVLDPFLQRPALVDAVDAALVHIIPGDQRI